MTDEREYDTSSLTHSNHALKIHRDYLAHVFRWGWATRYINERGPNGHRRVLEPGCGSDAPLAKALMRSSGPDKRPELYVGVDLGPVPYVRERKRDAAATRVYQVREHFDFVERWRELFAEFGPTFDLVVSFEVIEHMTEAHGEAYLWACNAMQPTGGTLLLSTPVFLRKPASNHIREYTVEELNAKLQRCGYVPRDRFGTFGSKPDVARGVREVYGADGEAALRLYERCRAFYGDDVLACFLAPLVPDHARNNVWVCEKTFEPWSVQQ